MLPPRKSQSLGFRVLQPRLHAVVAGGLGIAIPVYAVYSVTNLNLRAPQPDTFIGHPTAGERSAVIYTLPGRCRRHGLNPFDYRKDLFTRRPSAKITEIKQFTRRAWARAKAQEKMVAGQIE
jgi:hypothetical protein